MSVADEESEKAVDKRKTKVNLLFVYWNSN